MIFKRHAEKKKEKYYKISETQLAMIEGQLGVVEAFLLPEMTSRAVNILDKVKCKKADGIDWNGNIKRFREEEESISLSLEGVRNVLKEVQNT